MEMETCKLVFPAGTTQESIKDILAKNAKEYVLHTFQENVVVGCNKVSFVVVDLPHGSVPAFSKMEGFNVENLTPAIGRSSGSCCEETG